MGLKMQSMSTLSKHQKWQEKVAVNVSIFAVKKKNGFDTLHADILYESLTALEAEIFRFVIMHYAWKTLYVKEPLKKKYFVREVMNMLYGPGYNDWNIFANYSLLFLAKVKTFLLFRCSSGNTQGPDHSVSGGPSL